jgi:hypothetical protein
MTSIYAQVLGRDFARLHPQMQRRFRLTSGIRVGDDQGSEGFPIPDP